MRLIPVLLFASSALLAQGVAAQARIFCCTSVKPSVCARRPIVILLELSAIVAIA